MVVTGKTADYAELEPLATFREQEGLTLVLNKDAAETEKAQAAVAALGELTG